MLSSIILSDIYIILYYLLSSSLLSLLSYIPPRSPSFHSLFSPTEHLSPFNLCDVDDGWPPILRVSPLLSWSYSNIWEFIRTFSIPIPDLYNRGCVLLLSIHILLLTLTFIIYIIALSVYIPSSYSSIGTKSTTRPNPLLIRHMSSSSSHSTSSPSPTLEFLPPESLTDDRDERLSRVQ